MVTITNGEKSFRVTAGAVKPYLGMGFYVVTDEEARDIEQAEQVLEEDMEELYTTKPKSSGKFNVNTGSSVNISKDDAFVNELLEKPLSQWSNEEVKDFVKIKGIDTSGAQKVSQVRGIIKAYLEEEQKKNM